MVDVYVGSWQLLLIWIALLLGEEASSAGALIVLTPSAFEPFHWQLQYFLRLIYP